MVTMWMNHKCYGLNDKNQIQNTDMLHTHTNKLYQYKPLYKILMTFIRDFRKVKTLQEIKKLVVCSDCVQPGAIQYNEAVGTLRC